MASRPLRSPTVPETRIRRADVDPGDLAAAEEDDRQGAGAVGQHALQGADVAHLAHLEAADAALDDDRVAPAHLGHGPDGGVVTVPPGLAGRGPVRPRARRPGATPSRATTRGSSTGSIRSGRCGRRLARWNGTIVTLACGSRETSRTIASAVWSCRMRCQSPRYLRSGSSTHTSVSPSASSRATVSTAARVMRRSGHSTMSSGSRSRPSSRHASASSSAVLRVEVEVHGPQLVGRAACGRTGSPGPRRGRAGRRTRARRGAAGSARATALRHVVLELARPRPRTAG